MKKCILSFIIIGIGFSSLLRSQSYAGIELGTSYDYDVNVPELPNYKNMGSGKLSMFSFYGSLRIPFKKILNLYPTFIYSIPNRTVPVENLSGDYLPEGYLVQLPYKEEGNGWLPDYYGDDYTYFISDAEVWQKSYGAFLTIGKDFEIGSGLFLRNKTTYFYNTIIYDEYYWVSSEGTTWDNYAYYDTWTSGYQTETIQEKTLVVPAMVKYGFSWGNFYSGASFVYWFGADRYMSFRYSGGYYF